MKNYGELQFKFEQKYPLILGKYRNCQQQFRLLCFRELQILLVSLVAF